LLRNKTVGKIAAYSGEFVATALEFVRTGGLC